MKVHLILIISLLPLISYGDSMNQIASRDIGLYSEIIGQLGLPLFEECEVEGYLKIKKASRHKDNDHPYIHIQKINGILTDKEISISIWNSSTDEIPHNKLLKLNVIETGQLTTLIHGNQFADLFNNNPPKKEKVRQIIYTGISIVSWEHLKN